MSEQKNIKIAVFFDCENISGSHVASIFDELANYGEVIVKQSFKDWGSSDKKIGIKNYMKNLQLSQYKFLNLKVQKIVQI